MAERPRELPALFYPKSPLWDPLRIDPRGFLRFVCPTFYNILCQFSIYKLFSTRLKDQACTNTWHDLTWLHKTLIWDLNSYNQSVEARNINSELSNDRGHLILRRIAMIVGAIQNAGSRESARWRGENSNGKIINQAHGRSVAVE